jgi:peptidoglycan hydrolase-like protein with peptidoglycan-binding domain
MSVDYLAGYTRDYVLGDVAPEIRVIQKLLNNNGYTIANSGAGSKGQETDKLGLATQEALRRFQRSRDIPMTGNVGEQTYKALMDLQNGVVQTPAPVVSEPVPIVTAPVIETPVTALIQFTRNYVLGDVAPEIRIIQQLLNNNGYTIANSGAGSKGKETDKLGLATQEAIRRFQRDRGIEMTGNVGEQTYNALLQLQSGNVVAEPVVVAPVVPIPEVVVPPVQENVTRLTTFTQVYEVGDIAPEILVIQKLLNNNGYTIANSGAGSKGQETDKLGLATQEAIRRFQRDNGIPMTGNVGEQTYNALKALQPAAKKTGPDIIDV